MQDAFPDDFLDCTDAAVATGRAVASLSWCSEIEARRSSRLATTFSIRKYYAVARLRFVVRSIDFVLLQLDSQVGFQLKPLAALLAALAAYRLGPTLLANRGRGSHLGADLRLLPNRQASLRASLPWARLRSRISWASRLFLKPPDKF